MNFDGCESFMSDYIWKNGKFYDDEQFQVQRIANGNIEDYFVDVVRRQETIGYARTLEEAISVVFEDFKTLEPRK